MQDLAAVIAVDRHSPAPRDITHDRVPGNRLTAPCNGRHQVTHPLDGDIARAFGSRVTLTVGCAGDQIFSLWSYLFSPQAINGIDHLPDRQITITHRNKQIVNGSEAVSLDNRLEVVQFQANPFGFTFNSLFAGPQVFLAAFLLEPLSDLGPAPGSMDIAEAGIEPVAAGPGLLRCQNFHPVTGDYSMSQGHDTPIDLGAPAAMANLGMYMVGKIKHSGAGGQIHDLPSRRQNIDPILAGRGLKTVEQALIIQVLIA